MFQSAVSKAVMERVTGMIRQAEETYNKALTANETQYKEDIKSAKILLKQKNDIALETAVNNVFTSLK